MSRVERAPNVKLVKKTLRIEVPSDFELDEDEREWIEYIIERAARRGSGLEDSECATTRQRECNARIEGAERARRFILDLAGQEYACGKDSVASGLRQVAENLNPLLKELEKERSTHQELFLLSYQRTVIEKRAKTAVAAQKRAAKKSLPEAAE